MIDFHKKIIRIHKKHEALMRGSVKIVEASYNFLCYGRFTRKDRMMMVFNNSQETVEKTIRVHNIGMTSRDLLIRRLKTDAEGFDTDMVCYEVKNGEVHLVMPPTSAMIFHAQR